MQDCSLEIFCEEQVASMTDVQNALFVIADVGKNRDEFVDSIISDEAFGFDIKSEGVVVAQRVIVTDS